jgi:hypothetical protein
LAGFVWSIACITSDPPAKASAIDNVGRGLASQVNQPIPVAALPAVEDHDAPCGTPETSPCAR